MIEIFLEIAHRLALSQQRGCLPDGAWKAVEGFKDWMLHKGGLLPDRGGLRVEEGTGGGGDRSSARRGERRAGKGHCKGEAVAFEPHVLTRASDARTMNNLAASRLFRGSTRKGTSPDTLSSCRHVHMTRI